MSWELREGDCVEQMAAMPEASVDAVVCDPPYGLEFMGKDWDRLDATLEAASDSPGWRAGHGGSSKTNGVPFGGAGQRVRYGSSARSMQEWHEAWAREALRVLKPGGHLLAFGGTRTYHRLACAIEDAGFEIRDTIAWMYGSGFPKSLDVSKAIDAAAGAEREVVGQAHAERYPNGPGGSTFSIGEGNDRTRTAERTLLTAPATPDAQRWQGWGTALKPAHEPIVVARKPLAGTVAGNVLAHGTGALNIDATRIGNGGQLKWSEPRDMGYHGGTDSDADATANALGRWPANVVLDPEAAAMLDEQTGERRSAGEYTKGNGTQGDKAGAASIPIDGLTSATYADSGGASRFYYCAKASSAERGAGLDYARDGKICACPTRKVPAPSPPRATSEPTEADGFDSSTAGSGSSTTDRSPTASKSTISTRTRPTTGSRISSSSPPPSTSDCTPRTTAGASPASGSGAAPSAANGSPPTPSTSTSAERDGSSTDGADRVTSRESSPTSSSAVCADCGGVIEGAWKNTHPLEPTVKPIALMRWLVRLVIPPGGLVLDPFAGSGTTGCAAVLEGFRFVGIEREPEYAAIARARIAWWAEYPDGMELVDRLEAEKVRKAHVDRGQGSLFDLPPEPSRGSA